MLPHHCVLLNFSISSSLSLFLSLPTYDPFPTLTSHSLRLLSLSLTPALFLPTNIPIYFYIIDSDPGAGIGLVVLHISNSINLFIYHSLYLCATLSLCQSINHYLYLSIYRSKIYCHRLMGCYRSYFIYLCYITLVTYVPTVWTSNC